MYVNRSRQQRLSYFSFVEFLDDDEVVPKNASVIVKRLPAKNNGGLISRLKRREAQPHLKSRSVSMLIFYFQLNFPCYQRIDHTS